MSKYTAEHLMQDQHYTVVSMRKELDRANPSSFFHSVWFCPKMGRFMYNDQIMRYELIEPLISCGILAFKRYTLHQGKLMLRYVLSAKVINMSVKKLEAMSIPELAVLIDRANYYMYLDSSYLGLQL